MSNGLVNSSICIRKFEIAKDLVRHLSTGFLEKLELGLFERFILVSECSQGSVVIYPAAFVSSHEEVTEITSCGSIIISY